MSICQETRVGFAFNNPDTTSDYHAPRWGLLVSYDELRFDEMFGNALIAESDSQVITDDQLLDYARVAIAYLEERLNIDILPRRIRFQDPIGEDGNEIPRLDIANEDAAYTSQMTVKQKGDLYIREEGYPYLLTQARQEMRIKLRRRPLRNVLNVNFVDPYRDTTIIDLMPYRMERKGFSSVCNFRPRHSTTGSSRFLYIWNNFLVMPYFKNLRDIIRIDYETGYENCQTVPDEFRNIVKKLAAVTLMNIYGDGKLAAIASRSVNLNNVSESINTTLSATSATFGARIMQYQKEIKEWFAINTQKYSRTLIGRLG